MLLRPSAPTRRRAARRRPEESVRCGYEERLRDEFAGAEGVGPKLIAATELFSYRATGGNVARRASNARVRFGFSVM